MKKRIPFLITLMLFIILSACNNGEKKPEADAQPTENGKPSVEAFGIVDVLEISDISFGFPVKIEKLLAAEGQRVKGGETLAIVDISETTMQLKKLERSIAALRSETALLQDNLNKKKGYMANNKVPEILELEKKLEFAEKEYRQCLDELVEKKELADSGAISLNEYQEHLKRSDTLLFNVGNLQLSLEGLNAVKKDEILQDETAVNRNLLQISALEQDIQDMKDRLQKSCIKENKIISSIAEGIICNVDCRPGEIKAPGQRVFGVMNLDTIIINANIDEQFINDIKPAATAFIIPESDRGKEYKGKVTFISEMAIQKNGETVIPVRITLDKADHSLIPGYNVQVIIKV